MAESDETVDAPQLTMSNYKTTATTRPKKHTTPRSRGVKRSHTVPHGSRTKMAGLNATAVLPIDASIRGANIKTVRHAHTVDCINVSQFYKILC